MKIASLWRHLLPVPIRLSSEPWITAGAVAFLDEFLARQPDAHALEFGSGGSTIWFSRRVGKLVSFEHDPRWARAVRKALSDIPNVDLRLYKRPYFDHIAEFTDNSFDLVLVDGRDRVECARLARRVVRPGGVMMIDDTNRIDGRYSDLPALMADWKRLDFEVLEERENKGPKRRNTTVWTRPLAIAPV